MRSVKEIVAMAIETMFWDVYREHGLTTGDFSIPQSMKLAKCEKELVELVSEYVDNNKKGG